MWPSKTISRHIPQGNQNWKRHKYPSAHGSTMYNSQVLEATWMSIDRRIKQLWHIHTMQHYSAIERNTFESVPMRRMNSYTEWSRSERERQISYINAYIWNLEGWYWRICLRSSSGAADIENRLMDKGGGKKERVRWMQRVAWMHTR